MAVLAGEISIRFFFPEYSGLIYKTDPDSGLITYIPNATGYHGGVCFLEKTKINSLGWRDDEFTVKKPDNTYRIIVLGDSFAAALELPIEKTFHSLLEKKLGEKFKDKNFEVISLGRGNTGTYYYYRYLKDFGMKYSPDLVILMSFVNDPVDDIHDLQNPREGRIYSIGENGAIIDDYNLETSRWKLFIKTNLRKSQLIRFLYDNLNLDRLTRAIQSKPQTNDDDIANMDKKFAYELELKLFTEIKKLTDGMNIPLVVANAPYKKQVEASKNPNEPFYFKGDYSHEETLKNIAKQDNFLFSNLLPIFRERYLAEGKDFYFSCDGHWNEVGHEWAGNALFDYLTGNILKKI